MAHVTVDSDSVSEASMWAMRIMSGVVPGTQLLVRVPCRIGRVEATVYADTGGWFQVKACDNACPSACVSESALADAVENALASHYGALRRSLKTAGC